MTTTYERALKEVRGNGKFQRNFDIFFNMLFMAFWSIAYMNILLVLVITPYTCETPKKPDNFSDHQWMKQYIPSVLEANGETKFNNCYIFVNPSESNESQACVAYNYDRTWYHSTVPMEYDWVCEKEIYAANMLAYSRLSEAVGSIIFGWLGDIYGRRVIYTASLIFIIVGRGISTYAGNSLWLFALGCIIASFPSWSAVQSITSISLETSSPERRTSATTARAVAFSCGVCIMPFLCWWLQNWKMFLIITTAPQIVFVLLSWKLIESPRWLWLEGKGKECLKEMTYIADVNGTRLSEEVQKELLLSQPKLKGTSYGALTLFSSKVLAFNTLLQLASTVCITICYTVLLMTAGEKSDGNPFLEFAWQTAAEMPGNFLGAWISDRLGRRYAGIISNSVMAGIWIIVALRSLSTYSWTKAWWIGSALFMLLRLFLNVAYYVVTLFNMELYPTCVRQSGMSLGSVVGSAAAALAPYIIYLGHRAGSILPSVILTATSLLGIFCVYLLPETLNAKLPETLEDAKKFMKRKHHGTKKSLSTSKEIRNKELAYVAVDTSTINT